MLIHDLARFFGFYRSNSAATLLMVKIKIDGARCRAPNHLFVGGGLVDGIVTTRQGKVRGRFFDGVHAFKDIPFAAARFGACRFLPPQPVAPWEGVRSG